MSADDEAKAEWAASVDAHIVARGTTWEAEDRAPWATDKSVLRQFARDLAVSAKPVSEFVKVERHLRKLARAQAVTQRRTVVSNGDGTTSSYRFVDDDTAFTRWLSKVVRRGELVSAAVTYEGQYGQRVKIIDGEKVRDRTERAGRDLDVVAAALVLRARKSGKLSTWEFRGAAGRIGPKALMRTRIFRTTDQATGEITSRKVITRGYYDGGSGYLLVNDGRVSAAHIGYLLAGKGPGNRLPRSRYRLAA
ncbi:MULTISPECIES: hypothetical protein [unclassified Leifsonia]|uniref:hypothetical protein n=1 Tax=unclassified Leifsonia TaxID=2663824 RepID=UPI000B7DFE74|nr:MULTISPECIES: hypothetical protein [unclassified Leifsonia]